MVSNSGNRWAVAGSTFVLWGLVAASAVYWGTKLSGTPSGPPAEAATRSSPAPDPAAVARLLGSSPTVAAAPADPSSRFQLLGVVAGTDGGGAALLVVDGKPPKHYRTGAQVDENLVLKTVEPRRVALAPSMQAQPSVILELPRRP